MEIKQLLDKHGWLGPKQVGNRGNTTIWLVIQHADITTQQHYLPMMQAAADAGKATCGNLAYLEDRILAVSYTHLRAHETVLDLVRRLLLDNKTKHSITSQRELTSDRQHYYR